MSPFSLTDSQRTIVSALVELYNATEGHHAVTGEATAEEIDMHPESARNQMQSLILLQSGSGIPGQFGGYKTLRKPTKC
jgi:predicted transcriptional regulator